jgi:hypothetical protein
MSRIQVPIRKVNDSSPIIVIPMNLIEDFFNSQICIKKLLVCFMGDHQIQIYPLFEVHSLVISSQAGDFDNVVFPSFFSENKYFERLAPIGWIQTTPLDDSYLNPQDSTRTDILLQDRIAIISYQSDGY